MQWPLKQDRLFLTNCNKSNLQARFPAHGSLAYFKNYENKVSGAGRKVQSLHCISVVLRATDRDIFNVCQF